MPTPGNAKSQETIYKPKRTYNLDLRSKYQDKDGIRLQAKQENIFLRFGFQISDLNIYPEHLCPKHIVTPFQPRPRSQGPLLPVPRSEERGGKMRDPGNEVVSTFNLRLQHTSGCAMYCQMALSLLLVLSVSLMVKG